MQIAATIQNSILLQVNTQKKIFLLLVPLLNEKLYIKEEKREKKKDFQNWINNFSVMYIRKNMNNNNNDFRKKKYRF